jgi:hypothetical protein
MSLHTLRTLALSNLILASGSMAIAQDAPSAPPSVAIKSLQAIFMDVAGKVRWRPSADAEWRDAKVNDIVEAGTEIRTGLRSRATVRVGRNATVLVDSGTTFEVPEVVEEGAQLRTTASVRTGRVDFKVDKLDGFANDFKVVTPQTTLAVRGTGFSLATGALQGFEITGARTNMMNAIELKYVAQNLTYFVSGEGRSTSERQDPVQNAWVSTIGPPPVVGALVNNEQLVQQVAQGTAGNAPTNPQQQQQQAAAEAYGEAGSGMVVAANEPDASDAMRTLAVETIGQPGLVQGPSDSSGQGGGGTGGGGSGSGDLPPGWEQNLPEQLRTVLFDVRTKVPEFEIAVQDAVDLANEVRTQSATLAHDSSDPSLSAAVAQSQDGEASAMNLIQASLRQGQVDVASGVQGRGMDGRLWARVQNLEAGPRPDVFTSTPTQSAPQPGQLGVVDALENARAWSTAHSEQTSRDLLALQQAAPLGTEASRNEVGARLLNIFASKTLWSVDENDVGAGQGAAVEMSATRLALDLNEHIQVMWMGVVHDALLNGPGDLADLSQTQWELGMAISALRDHLQEEPVSDVPTGAVDFQRAFAAGAAQQGTPEARQAAAEVAVLAQQAKLDALRALQAAQQAFAEAGAARTLGQRVFAQHAGNAMVRRAAQWAERSQVAMDAILDNSWAMQANFRTGHASAVVAGAVPAVIDQGLNMGDQGGHGQGQGPGDGNGFGHGGGTGDPR